MDSPDSQASFENHLKTLGLESKTPTPQEIRDAFNRKSKSHHPDLLKGALGRDATPEELKSATDEMTNINAAKRALEDRAKNSGTVPPQGYNQTQDNRTHTETYDESVKRRRREEAEYQEKERKRKELFDAPPMVRQFVGMVERFKLEYPGKSLPEIEELNSASDDLVSGMALRIRYDEGKVIEAYGKERRDFLGMVDARRNFSLELKSAMYCVQKGRDPYSSELRDWGKRTARKEWREYISKYPVGKDFEAKMSAIFDKYPKLYPQEV